MASVAAGVYVFSRGAHPAATPSQQDKRREPRRLCEGDVRLVAEAGAADSLGASGGEFVARLMDVSQSGFRIAHGADAPVSDGLVFRFTHQIFRGRARVVWTRMCGAARESGFSLIRE
jgi:hypothetical protein